MTLKNLEESFNLLRKNPIIYLPDLFQALVSSILVYILYLYTGASSILPLMQSAETFSMDVLTKYLSENLISIIISVIIFVVITFFLGVGIMILRFSLVKDLISNRKASLSNAWKNSGKLFLPVVFIRLLLFAINFIVFGIIILLSVLIYYLISLWNPTIAPYFAMGIGGILVIAAFILLTLSFFFRYPILFMKNVKNPVKVLQSSLKLFLDNYGFVIYTTLIILGINVIFSMILYYLNNLMGLGLSLVSQGTLLIILGGIWSLIYLLFQLTITLWLTIFLFLKYTKSKIS